MRGETLPQFTTGSEIYNIYYEFESSIIITEKNIISNSYIRITQTVLDKNGNSEKMFP